MKYKSCRFLQPAGQPFCYNFYFGLAVDKCVKLQAGFSLLIFAFGHLLITTEVSRDSDWAPECCYTWEEEKEKRRNLYLG